MVKAWTLVTLAYLVKTSFSTPIKNGENVADAKMKGNEVILTGHKHYPYMALIQITVLKGDETETDECGGIIIGVNAVLTAGHCLYRKLNPTGTVHVGIVDRYSEANEGQKLKIMDFRVHELFREECKVGKRCCYLVNDIGMVWTEKNFVFGSSVSVATLGKRLEKPLNKEGWIIGWGSKSNSRKPTKLQRGRVRVISNYRCSKYDAETYLTEKSLCLKGVDGETRSSFGDSGGPLVIEGIVYGVCSMSILSNTCLRRDLDVYTYVPGYSKWIDRNLLEGPPRQRAGGLRLKPKHKI